MADTAIAITAGTGTNVDTRTEATNGNHRQVVVLGDPSTNAGVAPVSATAGLKVDLGTDNDVTVTGSLTSVDTITNAVTVNSHAVTNAGTFAVQAAQSGTWTVQPGNTANTTAWKVDGSAVTQPVSGTVTINAIPAGTNNIGDVDVLTVITGTGATNLGKAVDSAGGSTDTGVAILAIRDDALTTLTPVDGDYVNLRVNSTGALHVTGSSGVTEFAEDSAHSSGALGNLALAVRNDSGTTLAGTDGDYIPFSIDANGALRVTGGGGGTEYTEDAASAANPVGGVPIFVRRDTLSASEVSADGDNVAAKANVRGALWVAIDAAEDGGLIATGTAGTAATEVVTVQGIASMTPVLATLSGTNNIATVTTVSAVTAISNALPAGNNNIGDVDVASVVPGTGATNLGKAEDAAHTTGDVGVMALGVRNDAGTTLAGADGDYIPLSIDANGALRVTGGGGGTEYTEDAAAAANPVGHTMIVIREDGRAGSLVTADGDNVALRGNNFGELYVKHTDAIPITDNAGSLTVDGTVAVSTLGTITPGTAATSLGKAEDAAHSSGDVGVMGLAVRQDTAAALGGTDGDYQPLITDSTGRLHCNVSNTLTVASHAVTNAGTFAVQSSIAAGATTIAKAEDVASADADVGVPAMAVRKATPANTSGTDGDYEMLQMSAGRLWVDPSGVTLTVASHAVTNAGTFAVQSTSAGDVAHDGADSGNPVKVGGKATNVEPTAVSASGDRTNLITDLVGKLIVLPYANPENFVSGAITSAMTGTTTTSLIAAPASGLRNYITQITVSNAHATVGTDVIIQDGSGGTTLYTIPAAAVYGGATVTFPVPLRQPTTATAIFCANVTTGASTKVSASGYKGV